MSPPIVALPLTPAPPTTTKAPVVVLVLAVPLAATTLPFRVDTPVTPSVELNVAAPVTPNVVPTVKLFVTVPDTAVVLPSLTFAQPELFILPAVVPVSVVANASNAASASFQTQAALTDPYPGKLCKLRFTKIPTS